MRSFNRVLSVVACVVVAACLASTAQAGVIADWNFDGVGAAWLDDSSSNGHTLTLNTSGASTVSQVGGKASFTGGYLSLAGFDVSPYRQLTVSWDEQTSSTSTQIIYELSANVNGQPGAFIAAINNPAPKSWTSLSTADAMYPANSDLFPMSSGVWEHFAITYDLDSTDPAKVVRVFSVSGGSGTEIGTADPNYQKDPPAAFMGATSFNIGAREGFGLSFIGSMDNFKIESGLTYVPEPGTIVLLATGLIGLLAYAWRKRK